MNEVHVWNGAEWGILEIQGARGLSGIIGTWKINILFFEHRYSTSHAIMSSRYPVHGRCRFVYDACGDHQYIILFKDDACPDDGARPIFFSQKSNMMSSNRGSLLMHKMLSDAEAFPPFGSPITWTAAIRGCMRTTLMVRPVGGNWRSLAAEDILFIPPFELTVVTAPSFVNHIVVLPLHSIYEHHDITHDTFVVMQGPGHSFCR